MIHNLETKEQTYLGTYGAGGVGAIALHPSREFIAVGEKSEGGETPLICVYRWPTLTPYVMTNDEGRIISFCLVVSDGKLTVIKGLIGTWTPDKR